MRRAILVAVLSVGILSGLGRLTAFSAQGEACRFEMVTYTNEGLTIRGAGVYYKSDGKRYPILVFNHGTPSREDEHRSAIERMRPAFPCRFVQQYGWVFSVAERRGYGPSDGPRLHDYLDQLGTKPRTSERGAATANRLKQEAADVQAGIRFVQSQPFARQEYVAYGQSGGGVVSMFLGSEPVPGLLAVINSAGGISWNPQCQSCYYPEVSPQATTEAGKRINAPILIMTGSADFLREPNVQLYQALVQAGKRISLLDYPGLSHTDLSPGRWGPHTDDIVKYIQGVRPPGT